MSGTITVKPADGAYVSQPDRAGLPIPPEGAIVPDNSYYRRAVLTGDLIEVADAAPAEASIGDPSPAPDAELAAPGRRTRPPAPQTEQE